MSDIVQEMKKKKKVKIFQEIQKKLAITGYAPNQQHNNHRTFSKFQFRCVVSSIFATILNVVYIFEDTNSQEECMYSIFIVTISITINGSEISLASKNDDLFDMCNSFEEMLFQSKFQALFQL